VDANRLGDVYQPRCPSAPGPSGGRGTARRDRPGLSRQRFAARRRRSALRRNRRPGGRALPAPVAL